MKYDAVFTINCDDKPSIVTKGGSDGVNSYLEFELVPKNKAIKIEWADNDILKFEERGSQGGIPMSVTIDKNQNYKLVYRGGVLCEPGKDEAWPAPQALGEWREFFSVTNNVHPLSGARDISDWFSCIGGFGGGGAAIGATVGRIGGAGPMATGAGVGGVAGGAFGLGYCTANALYNPSTASTIHVMPQQPPPAVYIPPFHRDIESTDPFRPKTLSGMKTKANKASS